MIISIINLKGGVGKSTIAANLAIAFSQLQKKETLLIDTDQTGSCMKFMSIRSENSPDIDDNLTYTFLYDIAVLKAQIGKLKDKFETIVVDGAPSSALDKLTLATIAFSNIIIMPTNPNAQDLWALQLIAQKVAEAQEINPMIKAFFVLNNIRPNTNAIERAKTALQEDDILNNFPLFNNNLVHRIAYADAFAEGKSVLEYTNQKAKDDFMQFFYELCNKIGEE